MIQTKNAPSSLNRLNVIAPGQSSAIESAARRGSASTSIAAIIRMITLGVAISAAVRTLSGVSVRGQPGSSFFAVVLWSSGVPPPTSPEGHGRLLRRARGRVHTRNARSLRDRAVESRSTSALGVFCQPPPLDSGASYPLPSQVRYEKSTRLRQNCAAPTRDDRRMGQPEGQPEPETSPDPGTRVDGEAAAAIGHRFSRRSPQLERPRL